jgi:hypothetical protein
MAWWNHGAGSKTNISYEICETNDPSKVVLEIKADKILGKPQNKDFVMEYGRIAGAFEVQEEIDRERIKEF